jgi:hypothetical protein
MMDMGVRVDVRWTPEVQGLEATVREAESLREYGTYRASSLQIMRGTPEDSTLSHTVEMVLAAADRHETTVSLAYHFARRRLLTWVPEKMARAAK